MSRRKENDLKKRPEVSVVIPTFNRASWTKEAIDSVLAQEGVLFETIVVDDGSWDATQEVLSSYGERIRVLEQDHRGVSAARNRGIGHATGKWIAFLDSDDLWLPGKLSCQVRFFAEHAEARICQTEELWIRNGARVNPKRRHAKPSGDVFIASLELCLISPSAVMMDRSLFDEIGFFDEALQAAEDYDMWLRVSARHPVFLIETPLVVKRGGHDDQLSKIPGIDRFRIRAIEKRLESGELSPDRYRAAVRELQKKCDVYAGGCRRRGRIEEAVRYENLAGRFRAA